MEKMINSLKKLGLTRYEAQAYIGLNKIIEGNAENIAEASGLPRSRIYDILNDLEKKGFVEIERGRPLKYKVVDPNIIFKKEKNKLIEELESSENKLKELYSNEVSEIQAPVWLVHSNDNIIRKEVEIIKNAKSTLTMRIGFLLEGEANAMIKAFNEIPRNIKIRIVANRHCFVNDEKIDIANTFRNSKLDNLEVVEAEIPIMKMMIRDGKELFGTFARFSGENDSIMPQTAIGVINQYEDICQNFDKHFIKQFMQLNSLFNHN